MREKNMHLVPSLLLSLVVLQFTSAVVVGPWNAPTAHQITGTISFPTPTSLAIENFSYDNGGIRVFFYFYLPGQPVDGRNGRIIPLPFGGSQGELNRRFSNERIVLSLPAGVTACDVGTLTIWDEPFFATFSRVSIPRTIFLNNGEGECQFQTSATTGSPATQVPTTPFPNTSTTGAFTLPTSPPTANSTTTNPTAPPTQGVVVGALPNLQHSVSGTLELLSTTRILLRSFTYDGQGPPGTFLYYFPPGVAVDAFSERGIIIPLPPPAGESAGEFQRGRRYIREDLVVDLPNGTDVCDIATLTIWNQPFSVFFTRIDIPRSTFVADGEDPCRLPGVATSPTTPTTTPTMVTGTPSPLPPLTPEESTCIGNLVAVNPGALFELCPRTLDISALCGTPACVAFLDQIYTACGRPEFLNSTCDVNRSTVPPTTSFPTGSPSTGSPSTGSPSTGSPSTGFTTFPTTTPTTVTGTPPPLQPLTPEQADCFTNFVLENVLAVSEVCPDVSEISSICGTPACFAFFDQIITACGRPDFLDATCDVLGSTVPPTTSSTGFTTFPTTTPTTVTGTPSPLRPLTPEESDCFTNLLVDNIFAFNEVCSQVSDTIVGICTNEDCFQLLDTLLAQCGRPEFLEATCDSIFDGSDSGSGSGSDSGSGSGAGSDSGSGSGSGSGSPPEIDLVIEFEQPSYEVLEDIGLDNFALRVCLNFSSLGSLPESVTLFTGAGTAQGGEDYLPLVTEVSLNSEQDRICVSVIILEDERIEMDETFRIFVEGFGVSTLVTIIDDDDTSFNFTGNSPVVSNNDVTFNLSLGGGILEATCAVVRGSQVVEEVDCSSGKAEFINVMRSTELTPRITLITRRDPTPIVITDTSRNFRVAAGRRRRCSVHLINEGVTVLETSSNASSVTTIQWGLSAPSDVAQSNVTFFCSFDDGQRFECQSPLRTEIPRGSLFVRPGNSGGCIRGIGRNFDLM